LKKSLTISSFLEKQSEDTSSSAIEAFCFLNSKGAVYDMTPLYNSTEDYITKTGNYTVHLNFCKPAHHQCESKNTTAEAVLTDNKNNCYSLGGSESLLSKWKVLENSQTNETSLELTLSEGETCLNDPSKNYLTTIEIVCKKDADIPIFDKNMTFNPSACENKFRLFTKEACPDFSFYSFFNTVTSNKFILGPILLVLGIFICFFGYYFYDIMTIITGILLVMFLIVFLVLSNVNIHYTTTTFWIIIGCIVVIGIIVGYLFIKFELKYIIDIAIAGLAGYLLGVFIYNLFLNQISSHAKIVYFTSIVFSIILMVFLVLMYRRFTVILCTSFIGAYSAVRGMSLMVGGFPAESMVIDLIDKQEWGQLKKILTTSVYLYLAGILVLFIAGNIIQWVYFSDDKDDDKKNKEHFDGEHIPLKKVE
jgi:hypothetical protein